MTRAGFLLRSLMGLQLAGRHERERFAREIEIWHGEHQRVGHLGDAQDDFNLLGRVRPWQQVDRLTWSLNGGEEFPLCFRAWRRLAAEGDFNADIPVARLHKGPNAVTIRAYFRDGQSLRRTITVRRESGTCELPYSVNWNRTRDPQDVGQYVDGKWKLSETGLRTAETGYDRLFLIGERSWRDYEVKTSLMIHGLDDHTTPVSGGHGVGLILRFAGHVTGGPRAFPSGQPKWGYQPFGAIAWLRWNRRNPSLAPELEFYPGDSDRPTQYGRFPVQQNRRYAVRARCETLDEDVRGENVSRFSFKIWDAASAEPEPWSWQHVQRSAIALSRGGVALVAHHADASFGDLEVQPVR